MPTASDVYGTPPIDSRINFHLSRLLQQSWVKFYHTDADEHILKICCVLVRIHHVGPLTDTTNFDWSNHLHRIIFFFGPLNTITKFFTWLLTGPSLLQQHKFNSSMTYSDLDLKQDPHFGKHIVNWDPHNSLFVLCTSPLSLSRPSPWRNRVLQTICPTDSRTWPRNISWQLLIDGTIVWIHKEAPNGPRFPAAVPHVYLPENMCFHHLANRRHPSRPIQNGPFVNFQQCAIQLFQRSRFQIVQALEHKRCSSRTHKSQPRHIRSTRTPTPKCYRHLARTPPPWHMNMLFSCRTFDNNETAWNHWNRFTNHDLPIYVVCACSEIVWTFKMTVKMSVHLTIKRPSNISEKKQLVQTKNFH